MDPATNKPTQSRGLPVWTLLVTMLVGGLILIGLLITLIIFARDRSNARAQAEASKAERAELEARTEKDRKQLQETRTLALQRRELVLSYTANATNLLGRLLTDLRETTTMAEALRSNDAGRQVAAHPNLVAQARRFYENTLPALPSPSDVVARLEGARRIQQTLIKDVGSTFAPGDETTMHVQAYTVWAEQHLERVYEAHVALRSLVGESTIKVNTAPVTDSSPTLDEAIALLREAESARFQRTMLAEMDAAEQQRLENLARAEADAIVSKAQVQAAKITEDARIAAEKIRREMEEARLRDEIESMEERGGRTVRKSEADVALQRQELEAEKIRLREKASRPEVRQALSPFITPGLWQVGHRVSYEMQPLSLTAIRNFGALEQSEQGMMQLYEIGATMGDRVRPRWRIPRNFLQNPEQNRMVQHAQLLLIELGEVLVEMGLLTE